MGESDDHDYTLYGYAYGDVCILTMDALTVAKLTMAQVYRQTTQRDLRQELKSGTGGKLGKLVRPLRPTLTLTLRNNNPNPNP